MRPRLRPSGTVQNPQSCPAPDALWRALHGQSSHESSLAVLAHCGQCETCAQRWKDMCEHSLAHPEEMEELRSGPIDGEPAISARDLPRSSRNTRPRAFDMHNELCNAFPSRRTKLIVASALAALLLLFVFC